MSIILRFITYIFFMVAWTCSFAASVQERSVIIVGAGVSGLAAAKDLQEHGIPVLVLEARNRIGGRIHSIDHGDYAIDLGAGWLHGVDHNPITELVKQYRLKTQAVYYDDNELSHKLSSWKILQSGLALSQSDYALLQKQVALFEEFVSDTAQDHAHDSIQDAFRIFTATHMLEKRLQNAFRYIVTNVYLFEYGVDLDELSWQSDMPYDQSDISGVNLIFPKGYSQIIPKLAEHIPVTLNEAVTKIKYGKSGVTIFTAKHHQYNANYAIITVPLGVLASGKIQFVPSLPKEKMKAIKTLKMSVYNKIVLIYPTVFWDKTPEWISAITKKHNNEFDLLNMYPLIHQPVLIAFTGGRFAKELEGLSDQAVIQKVTTYLRSIYGGKTLAPLSYHITRWFSDPYSKGSYSYLPRGVSLTAYRVLAAPVANRIFFAGEATSETDPSTVQGAYMSGKRAAAEVRSHLSSP